MTYHTAWMRNQENAVRHRTGAPPQKTEKRETKKSLVFHKPFTTYNNMVDIAIIMTDG